MKILFVLILISGANSNTLKTYPQQRTISNDLSNNVDVLDSFLTIYDRPNNDGDDDDVNSNDLNVFEQLQQQIYLNKLHQQLYELPAQIKEPRKMSQTAYLLVKTMRQRDKRYISYLTLCHFKICNMGRKRTTRYFHMIRTLDDNHA